MWYLDHDKCTLQKGDHDRWTYPKVSSKQCNNKLKKCVKIRK